MAEDDRCEKREADEVARRHTWAHNGRKAYRCEGEETVKIRESLQFTKVYSPARKASSQVMRSAKKVST